MDSLIFLFIRSLFQLQLTKNIFYVFQDLHSPTVSNEVDSLRDGSENQDVGPYRSNNNSTLNCGNQMMYHNTSDMDVDFPPKPVIFFTLFKISLIVHLPILS